MTTNSAFELVGTRGWLRGFGNLLGNELARWWKTRMGWVMCLLWSILTVALLNLWGDADRRFSLLMFSQLAGVFQAVGVVVIMQGTLVGEKVDGRAAWILSRPVTRTAYILSKLAAYSLGVLVTMVLLSGAIVYAAWLVRGAAISRPIPLLEGLGIISLSHLWYMTLTLMLAALFDNRVVILGISGGLLALSENLVRLPLLGTILPWNLTVAGEQSCVVVLLSGYSIHSFIPNLVAVGVGCILFVLIALWRFNRQEL
jgi:ABC-2 type transport system permease protein